MTLRPIPDLPGQVAEILLRHGLFDRAAGMTEEIIRAVEEERDRPCMDKDCARRQPHSRPGPHAWRHEADPPFTRVPFTFLWLCFSCGKPKGHRIHRV